MSTDDKVTVSTAEFHRNVGLYQDIALTKPVTITKNGRERTVLLSAQEYARLKRRDRRVIAAGELSERQVDAIRNAECRTGTLISIKKSKTERCGVSRTVPRSGHSLFLSLEAGAPRGARRGSKGPAVRRHGLRDRAAAGNARDGTYECFHDRDRKYA